MGFRHLHSYTHSCAPCLTTSVCALALAFIWLAAEQHASGMWQQFIGLIEIYAATSHAAAVHACSVRVRTAALGCLGSLLLGLLPCHCRLLCVAAALCQHTL